MSLLVFGLCYCCWSFSVIFVCRHRYRLSPLLFVIAKLIIALFVVCFDVFVSRWSLLLSLVVVRRLCWSLLLLFVAFVSRRL